MTHIDVNLVGKMGVGKMRVGEMSPILLDIIITGFSTTN